MMYNYQNTSDLQAVSGEALFVNDFQNSGAKWTAIAGQGTSNAFSSLDSHNAKIDQFQGQIDYYQGFMPTQDSYIKATSKASFDLSEKLPRIEKVFEEVSNFAEFSPAGSSKSTLPDSCYSFEQQTPATSQIFESRLHQLYKNLHSLEDSSKCVTSLQNFPKREFRQNTFVESTPGCDGVNSDMLAYHNALQEGDIIKKASEITTQYEKLEMKNLKRHYKMDLMQVSIKKKCQKRGRKRVNVLPAQNFDELLSNLVVPKWTTILTKKTKREGEPIGQVTDEYLWTKVLRDMRDFFRIIFKSRFHRSEKREDSNRDLLVKMFLQELGITDISFLNSVSTFDFLYKAHYKARSTNEGKIFKDIINSTPMRIYYYYSETVRENFLQDDLCSRLLYYFLVNFGVAYLSCIQKNLRPGVESIINYVTKRFSYGS